MNKHSYNELKEYFLLCRSRKSWMPFSLPFLSDGIDPNEKIYSDEQFDLFKEYFLDLRLDNPLCKRINCFDINLNHTHSTPETKEEYQERIIRLLEEWKDTIDNHPERNKPDVKHLYEEELNKIIEIISYWKGNHSFEEKVIKFSDFFDNARAHIFHRKQSHLSELRNRCEELLKEESLRKEINGKKDENNNLFSSPWMWIFLLIVVIIGYLLLKKVLRD